VFSSIKADDTLIYSYVITTLDRPLD